MSVDVPDWITGPVLQTQSGTVSAVGGRVNVPLGGAAVLGLQIIVNSGAGNVQILGTADGTNFFNVDAFSAYPPVRLARGGFAQAGFILVPVQGLSQLSLQATGTLNYSFIAFQLSMPLPYWDIGQEPMASSLPVVIASDQSSINARGLNSPTDSGSASALVNAATVAAAWTNSTATFVLGANTRYLYGLLWGILNAATGAGFCGLRLKGQTSGKLYDLVQRVLPSGGSAGNEAVYSPPRDLNAIGFTVGETIEVDYFTTQANSTVWVGLELGP